jgi:glycosyltransferase involved in cell wall biosynthesis
MDKLNILVVNWQCIKNPSGGGAEVHFHEIFKRIAAMGHKVTLFCSMFPGALPEETVDAIRISRKGSRSLFNFYVKREYRKRFSKEHYDIVIDDINKIPFYMPRYVKEPLLAISHHFFGKSIFREAGFISALYVYLSEKLVDCYYKKTKFVVVSQSTLDEFVSRGFNKNNFSIVHNAIDQNEFPMAGCVKSPHPVITYFGRLKKYKSPDHLIRAFAKISPQFPTAELHIIGRGDFRQKMEKLARELGIMDKLKFFGYVSEEEKKMLLALSHCVVNTSMKEGWGITNIEANACATLTISSNVPGLRDSVSVGLSGLLYEYGDINMLAETLKEVLGSQERLRLLSEGAVKWASNFSWDESARKMLEVIYKTIN